MPRRLAPDGFRCILFGMAVRLDTPGSTAPPGVTASGAEVVPPPTTAGDLPSFLFLL